MARFVLVHGAFGGAWTWEPCIGPLETLGHTVEAFDLPGAGERPRHRSRSVTAARAYAERVVRGARRRRPRAGRARRHQHGRRGRHAGRREPPRAGRARSSSSARLHARQRPEHARPGAAPRRRRRPDPGESRRSRAIHRSRRSLRKRTVAAVYNCCSHENGRRGRGSPRPQPVAPFATPVRHRRRRARLDTPLLRARPAQRPRDRTSRSSGE